MASASDILTRTYGDPRWLEPEDVRRNRVLEDNYSPWPTLPPAPAKSQAEVRNLAPRPSDQFMPNEEMVKRSAGHVREGLSKGSYGPALLDALELIAAMAPISGAKRGRLGPKGSEGPAGARPGPGAEARGLPEPGGLRGGDAELSAPRGLGNPYTPIPGQPATVKIPGYGEIEARPVPGIRAAREDYLQRRGLPNNEPLAMPEFDVERARRIAQAYADMKHDPTNPDVRRAYDSMINETLAQLDALERQGYRFKFNKAGEDPYAASPALGYLDVVKNGELSVFPTLEGFGSGVKLTPAEVSNNPLLTDVGRKWGDKPITANDAFRGVHDMFGHFGEGNPFFRHKGEERAWGHHIFMYPPSAQGAMTSETRGQNSWLNFGPHAEHNRTASGADTIYADQKTGLMPEWTWTEGRPETKKADGGGVGRFANPNMRDDGSWHGLSASLPPVRPLSYYNGEKPVDPWDAVATREGDFDAMVAGFGPTYRGISAMAPRYVPGPNLSPNFEDRR